MTENCHYNRHTHIFDFDETKKGENILYTKNMDSRSFEKIRITLNLRKPVKEIKPRL